MRLKRCVGLLIVAIGLGAESAASQTPVAPERVVREIYQAKIASAFGKSFDVTDAMVDSHFAPELKALYRRAAHAPEPVVDFDIFYDAQDCSISNLDVRLIEQVGVRAVVRASFDNYGEPTTVFFDMHLVDGTWMIEDLRYASGHGLREIMAEP